MQELLGARISDEEALNLLRSANTAELMARAVRDHLADCLCTLPSLLEREADASVHFFMGNLSGMRQHLFPALGATYQGWLDTGHDRESLELADRGRDHWYELATEMLELYREQGPEAADPVADLVESRRL